MRLSSIGLYVDFNNIWITGKEDAFLNVDVGSRRLSLAHLAERFIHESGLDVEEMQIYAYLGRKGIGQPQQIEEKDHVSGINIKITWMERPEVSIWPTEVISNRIRLGDNKEKGVDTALAIEFVMAVREAILRQRFDLVMLFSMDDDVLQAVRHLNDDTEFRGDWKSIVRLCTWKPDGWEYNPNEEENESTPWGKVYSTSHSTKDKEGARVLVIPFSRVFYTGALRYR